MPLIDLWTSYGFGSTAERMAWSELPELSKQVLGNCTRQERRNGVSDLFVLLTKVALELHSIWKAL